MATRAASTRTEPRLAVMAAMVGAGMLALTGCGATATGTQTGDAVRADGLSSIGNPGIPTKSGTTWRIAFPLFKNVSRKPLQVTSVSVDNVPRGVKVVGYPVYSLKDTGAVIIDSRDGDGESPDMTKMRTYPGPITVAPHQTSDRFAMARVRIVGPVSHNVTGCRVNYTQDHQQYTQVLKCEWDITAKQ